MIPVERIPHTDLIGYLRLSGWSPREGRRSYVSRFEHAGNERSGEEPIEVEVVTDPDLRDYDRRNTEAVRTLAAFNGLTVDQVREAVASPAADVLAFRIQAESMAAGSIPLDESIRLRRAQRGLLLAAAHSILEPRDHFPRMSRKEAAKLVSQVREGQTARGSYISRLFVPLPRPVGEPDPDEPQPYARRVTSGLLCALHSVSTAVLRGAPERLLDTQENPGVSANLLNALTGLQPPGPNSFVSVSASWSGVWSTPPETPSLVRFSRGDFETFGALAKQLRDRQQTPQHVALGYIVNLNREDEVGPGGPGRVVLLDRRSDMRIRIEVDGDQYDAALKAHRTGQRIRVVGTLRKVGRLWSLDAPSPIVMASDDDDSDDDGID